MRSRIRPLALLAGLALVCASLGCAGLPSPKGEKLTDAHVTRYIQATRNLKRLSPAFARTLGRDGVTPDEGAAGFAQVEKAIKDAGFKDYPEFVRTNAAIAWAFSQGQAGAFMKDTQAKKQAANAQIAKVLADPSVPEATKAALRAQQQEVEKKYAESKGWADVAMGVASQLTDKDSVALVMKHRKELEAAITAK